MNFNMSNSNTVRKKRVLKSVILKVRLFHFMFVIRIRHSK